MSSIFLNRKSSVNNAAIQTMKEGIFEIDNLSIFSWIPWNCFFHLRL